MTDYIEKIEVNSTSYPIGGDMFDSQWSTNSTQILSNATLSGGSYTPCDLSNYLPDDNYDYEVMFVGVSASVATSGKVCQLTLFSGMTAGGTMGYRLNRCQARTASATRAGGSTIVPIYSNHRYVTIYTQDSNTNNTGVYFNAVGYRRIGNNISSDKLYAWHNTDNSSPITLYTITIPTTANVEIYCYNNMGKYVTEAVVIVNDNELALYNAYGIYTRQSSDDIELNYVSNINSYPIGGNNFNGEVVMFDTDQSSLSVGTTNSSEHNLLFDSTTLSNSTGHATFSVANVIPNDGYDYELCLSVWSRPPATNGNALNLLVTQGTHTTRPETAITIGYRIARTGATYADFKTFWLPISASDKNITFFNISSHTATYNCMVHGYRRIGTND